MIRHFRHFWMSAVLLTILPAQQLTAEEYSSAGSVPSPRELLRAITGAAEDEGLPSLAGVPSAGADEVLADDESADRLPKAAEAYLPSLRWGPRQFPLATDRLRLNPRPLSEYPGPGWKPTPLIPPFNDQLFPRPADPPPSSYYEVKISKRWVWLAVGLAVIAILNGVLEWLFPRRLPQSPAVPLK